MSEPTEELKGNEPKREKVRIIPIELIDDFPDHPFLVKDDESMEQLMLNFDAFIDYLYAKVYGAKNGRYKEISSDPQVGGGN